MSHRSTHRAAHVAAVPLALTTLLLSGAAIAQTPTPATCRAEPVAPADHAGHMFHRHDHAKQTPSAPLLDLGAYADESALVFDAELIRADVVTPEGMGVLVTEYEFRIHEWLRGEREAETIVFRETGGVEADGDGMATCHSHKLEVGGRYIIFTRDDAEQMLAPFRAVLQSLDGGDVIANADGALLVENEAGDLSWSHTPGIRRARYLPPTLESERHVAGPPDFASEPVPAQPAADEAAPSPVRIDGVLERLRPEGAPAPVDAPAPGLSALPIERWNYCGWIDRSHNFFALLPDNDHWEWFNDSASDWNWLVENNPSGPDWLVGYFTSGGNPIRNRLPVAGNGDNNVGAPSSTVMNNGGYGTWADNGNPNGITFFWFSGGDCTRLVETDAFVNPVNGNDEAQFRKTMTHELGHALGLGHEDRYAALMVAGTFRIPPNYSSQWYNRRDDLFGGRAMLNGSNGIEPGSWNLDDWSDPATWSQTHPNQGSPGNVLTHVTQLSTYTAAPGDTITIRNMHVENRGTLAASPLDLKIYLSTNNIISDLDNLVWSGGWSSFAGGAVWSDGDLNFTIPSNLPDGDYYIGWILTTPTNEPVSTANNTAIMVDDFWGGFSERTISISRPTPPNNSCFSASSVSQGTYYGTTEGADSNGSASCGFSSSSPDVWHRYTAPCDGTVTFNTCGSDYDTVLSVHTSCFGSAQQLACNDDAQGGPCSGTLRSRVSVDLDAGQTVYIRVSGYNGSTGDYTLNVGSCVEQVDCPGDANGDRTIDAFDLADLLTSWGPIGGYGPFDMDEDGTVGAFDLAQLLTGWGACD